MLTLNLSFEGIVKMAKYDTIADSLSRNCWDRAFGERAANVIRHLQNVIRDYNPDDAIFDDEKEPKPGTITVWEKGTII